MCFDFLYFLIVHKKNRNKDLRISFKGKKSKLFDIFLLMRTQKLFFLKFIEYAIFKMVLRAGLETQHIGEGNKVERDKGSFKKYVTLFRAPKIRGF